MKLITALLAAILVVGLTVADATGAFGATTPSSHATYALGHAKKCRTSFVKTTERRVETKRVKVDGKWRTVDVTRRVKVHGKWETEKVTQRYVACVYVAPVTIPFPTGTTTIVTTSAPTPPTATSPGTPAGNSGTTPPVTTVTATIDPSYTLPGAPQSPPIPVTFSYSAGVANAILPTGELTLSIFEHDSVSAAGGCQANVGGATATATCTVSIPVWGTYDLITSYSSGVSNVASTGQTDVVNIEPPAPSPETVVEQWGGATASANVVGSTASVVVTDANWQGPIGSLNVTDQLGDSCTLSITGTTGTCSMTVSGTPSSFTVAYPGGTSISTTQTISPWGIAQSQSVTYTWLSDSVLISNPSVTVQAATVAWNGYRVESGASGTTPANPLVVSSSQYVQFSFATTGNVLSDPYPLGYIVVTVSGPSGYTVVNTGGFGSSDCSELQNYSGQAVGTCRITFSGSGVFTVTSQYISQDIEYGPNAGLSETVNVTS